MGFLFYTFTIFVSRIQLRVGIPYKGAVATAVAQHWVFLSLVLLNPVRHMFPVYSFCYVLGFTFFFLPKEKYV